MEIEEGKYKKLQATMSKVLAEFYIEPVGIISCNFKKLNYMNLKFDFS